METFDYKNNRQLDLVISIKTGQLRRDELDSITYEHVRSTLYGFTWAIRKPKSFHEAVDDILHLHVNEIIAYLSNQAIILGSQMKLEDFEDMFQQEEHHQL